MKSHRYAAKLLFQFRSVSPVPKSRRLCEERIVLVTAASPRRALAAARRKGRAGQLKYRSGGTVICVEFVGVLGLVELDDDPTSDEVWWEFSERVRPMERRTRIVPKEAELAAVRQAQPVRAGSRGARYKLRTRR